MRVLYLTDSLSDLDGVGRYGVRLIAALEELQPDLEVEVLLGRKHRPTSADVPDRWRVSVGLPPDYFFYMKPVRFWAQLHLSVRRAARAAREADLVHAIKDYPHNLVALRAARRAGVPCVATAHGTYSLQPLLQERHRRRALDTYRGFARMIAVSGYTRRRMLEAMGEASPGPDHIRFIPNAVDAERYAGAMEETAAGDRPWRAHPFTLTIAEVKERKGLHLAVEAWSRIAGEHPGLHHYIVGKASGDAYQASLLETAASRGLADRLHLLGNVLEADKVDLLQRAEVFLHTPVTAVEGGFEGFGIVYLEAGASGTPVIGTLDCGAEDAILDGSTGFLVEPRPEAVEAALARLMGDGALRQRMGAEGCRHARASSWRRNAEQVLAVYREALG